MKVLLSAIACNPYGHSELYIGWSAVRCLARDHEVWVLTSKRAQPNIERAQAEGLLPANVHFVYAGHFQEWHPNRLLARLQSWKEYLAFATSILDIARELHRVVQFDVVHHVTYATWRVASPLWRLGIPFVFGPIGGNAKFPLRLLPLLSPPAAGFELLRTLSNRTAQLSPSVRACLRQAAHVFTVDAETEALVKEVRRYGTGVSWLLHAFFSEATFQAFARHANQKTLEGPLRLFAGGNLIGAKGIALAFQALIRAKGRGVRFCYRLSGGGPEAVYLHRLAARIGLQDDVLFSEPLSGEAYQKELGASHLLLLPSLRESAGLTMMEAMMAGCVPVVADCGGPARIVTDECGYKVPVSNCEQMVDDLANVILTLNRHREIILQKGAAASERIGRHFTEENYRSTVNAVYRAVANP